MAIKVRNLTTSKILLPEPINSAVGPRADKVFEYVEFDEVINTKKIVRIINSGQIEVFSLDSLAVGSGGGNFSVLPSAPELPAAGDIWYNSTSGWDTLFIYDENRLKWLSISEFPVGIGRDAADGNLLLGYGIQAAATGTGVLMPRDAAIKRLSARGASGSQTKTFDVLVNGSSALTFSLSSREYYNNTLNIDLTEGDNVWVEADGAGGASNDVIIIMWISWRVSV